MNVQEAITFVMQEHIRFGFTQTNYGSDGTQYYDCPECFHEKQQGHAADCRMAEAIRIINGREVA